MITDFFLALKKNNLFKPILMFLVCALLECNKDDKGTGIIFEQLKSTSSGITFSNDIAITNTLNYNTFPYIYMGGGVALGDINNDGLTDVFLTGNMVPNKLYLNKGNMKFDDIGHKGVIQGDSRWYTGATMVDINMDGLLDIYVCVSGVGTNTANQLFINNGDLTFTEKAEEYGIADKSNSIQSTFFDYDNDGDLDLYVCNYPIIPLTQPNHYYFEKMQFKNKEESGHLYKNQGNGKFVDMTEQSGVLNFGLSLGVIACDFNNDGWQDLYISNDFNVPDYFYLNNGNGTFKEIVKEATKQTSMFGMGVDAADFNNDGLMDLLQVDMTPEDHYRSKTNMASMDQKAFEHAVSIGFHHQYMQNSLQVNNGANSDGVPIMSNVARLTGMATTDWSWGALFADFDNDGLKDIVITNGMRLDVNNNDLLSTENATTIVPKKIDMHDAPVTPIENYLYKNKGNYAFENVSQKWNANLKGFSNGIAYGDLDNDGDLDMVVNNIDEKATLLKNNISNSNFLRIKLKGPAENPLGMGAKIKLTTENSTQWVEQTLTRGFQSSIEPIAHFGLGKENKIEELKIIWPDGKVEYQRNLNPNQTVQLEYSKATEEIQNKQKTELKFKDITPMTGIDYVHIEDGYDDFLVEPLLPHKNSQEGPGLAVGDVNNDGLEDFFIGNARNKEEVLFLQSPNGRFKKMPGPWNEDHTYEDTGAIFFDADNDGDQDLYVVSGGNSITLEDTYYQDRLYINTPDGYIKSESALPKISSSGLKVVPADYDGDGDMDLFVGGRIKPGHYLQPPISYLLRNEGGENTDVVFKDVTLEKAPELQKIGLVTDALWHDYNEDGKVDLILTGEWMPLTFFENDGENLVNITDKLNMDNTLGWWYSLAIEDLDNDGDKDIIAGNLGLNSKYKTNKKSPFEIYVNDFDGNKRQDIVLGVTKKGVKLPVRGRECSSQQIPIIKKNFKTYELFASASLEDIYGKKMLEQSIHYKANTFAHHWFENKGGGKYDKHPLPIESQLSSINDIVFLDYDGDGYKDMLVAGNLYSTEAETPRMDAGVGLILKNNQNGKFHPVSFIESGLLLNNEVKNIMGLKLGRDKQAYIFAINDDKLKVIAFDNQNNGDSKIAMTQLNQ
ncbi:VCBS repeat-containing protein [Flagellimonas onchidii]|uniref:VCBS repeat-containing protein n=1 Tax=Flagellimonas onchidii TaxID=2562684 RepID=UPI0010A62397|nr:VCBS repeat-containing protein [Allomuricauda onchidii]